MVGCQLGKTVISAQAEGFARVTRHIELSANTPPCQLVLQRGKTLRLRVRVVDPPGNPVPGVFVCLNVRGRMEDDPLSVEPPPPQYDFEARSDVEGRVVWGTAPDQDLWLHLHATRDGFGTLEEIQVHPDGREHTIFLPPEVAVAGTVRDAVSGEPIPRFRVLCGRYYATSNRPLWDRPQDEQTLFFRGVYRYVLPEAFHENEPQSACCFRFEADGYEPFGTRLIRPEEGEVRFEVSVQPHPAAWPTALSRADRVRPGE